MSNIKGKQSIVVAGEASESEEDEEISQTQTNSSQISNVAGGNVSGVIVSGEDSDSAEEAQPVIPPLKVNLEGEGDSLGRDGVISTSDTSTEKPAKSLKYDTLLHRKLAERNCAFHKNMQKFMGQMYLSSGKEIKSINQHLASSHTAIQEVSHNMRLMTKDLFMLGDKFDIIRSCTILPKLNVPVADCSSTSSSVSSPRSSPLR